MVAKKGSTRGSFVLNGPKRNLRAIHTSPKVGYRDMDI